MTAEADTLASTAGEGTVVLHNVKVTLGFKLGQLLIIIAVLNF